MAKRCFILMSSHFISWMLVFCPAAQVFAAGQTYTLSVRADSSLGAWNRYYEQCVGTCHPITVLHSVYGRNIQNAMLKGEPGVRPEAVQVP